MSETRDATPARVNYFYGQFLQEEDFLAEQAYHIGQQRRLAQILRRPGIIRGLQVEVLDKDTGQVRVNPGLAVDGLGQLIVLNPSKGLDLRDADGIHVLTISFGLEGTSQTTTGNEGYSRMREQPSIAWYPDGQAPPNDTHPRLGRLRLSAGKIVALDNSDPNALIDTSVRTAAAMSVEGNLDVVGNSGLGGTLTVESGTALNSTLSVKARATLQNGLTISGAQAEVQNGLVVRNPSGLALTVSQGATQLQGGLRVSLGATQLQGGLTVSGAQAEVQNGLVVRNPSGPALTVSQGATQLQGGLVVRSGSDAAGSVGLSVTQGATQLQGGLTANGGSTLTGGTTIGGDLTVNGSAMMNGNVTLGTAGGSAQITVHGMTVIRGSQGHLQLRRTANTTGVATMALELYQEDVPNVTDSPTPLSIRFQHASIYSHRIEASTNGFSFMAGDLNNSTPSNIQAATVTAARFLGPGSCPTGTILMWAGALSAVPTGWQLCNGQSLSRTEYAGLFGVIGMTYGADNSATFRVPNLLERFVVGANNFTYPVGATGGQAMVTLTVNQMPSHNHQAGGHSYLLAKTRSGTIKEADTFGDEPDLTSAYPIQPAGGDQAHENRPPYLALAFIIKS